MKFLAPDDVVDLYQNGFDEDVLGRRRVGEALSSLIERVEDPLVIALDGRWGTGKSYFLKRWVGAHRNENGGEATTVYFDAFAHDYADDPLIALVGTLSARIPTADKSKIERIKSLATRIIKPVGRLGLSLATFGATQALDEIGDAVVEAVSAEAKVAIDDFWKREESRRTAMIEFQEAISALVEETNPEKPTPLVIVIDELDRCRPDYALQVLEIVKHFFAVPRVHFILGVNLNALENSVKVRYGSGIDAAAYLKKFITLTASLPESIGDPQNTPSTIAYIDYMGKQMSTPEHLAFQLKKHIGHVSMANPMSIRDISKIMSQFTLLPERILTKKRSGWMD